MKPEIIIIGEEPKQNKNPIEFLRVINYDGTGTSKIDKPDLRLFKKVTIVKIRAYSFDCICICEYEYNNVHIFTAMYNDGVLDL